MFIVRPRWFLLPCIGACAFACATTTEDGASLGTFGSNVGGSTHVPAAGGGQSAGAAGAAGNPVTVEDGAGGQPTTPPPNKGMGGGGIANAASGGAGGLTGAGGFMPSSGGAISGTGGVALGTGGREVSGTGGASAGAGGTVVGGNSGKCTFTFDVTTVTANGRYAPRNAGAIWITDAQNKFVKTLSTWSYFEIAQVTAWVQASGNNRVDAVTGATRASHGPVNATWNCTDVQKNAVPDGQYAVHVSFAESDANPFVSTPAIQASVTFTKSAAGADVPGQDTANFKSMHAKLTSP